MLSLGLGHRNVVFGSTLGCLSLFAACGPGSAAVESATSNSEGAVTATDAGSSAGTGEMTHQGEGDGNSNGDGDGDGDGDFCECIADHERIYLLSDQLELWSLDPLSKDFQLLGALSCPGADTAYSMAVSAVGVVYLLGYPTQQIFRVDLQDPSDCVDAGWLPGTGGFGLFGMSFAALSAGSACEELFVHSYSGQGPFSEGPGAGRLGRVDPGAWTAQTLSTIDFDGGELAGSGEGRLFAFAGAEPAKLLEYDKQDGGLISTHPLEGFSKTNASAFAFWGGEAYLFTEAGAVECPACLESNCAAELAACEADPSCLEQLECAMQAGEIDDACGGLIPAALQSCMAGPCVEQCFPATSQLVSKVDRVQLGSPVAPQAWIEAAPARFVGAASSVCAPYNPP